ncbi:hypothetical protein ACIQU4_26460 [Streptomyces sp. NPDC090741]|uniref:hypothetical protein n=1 Tax=Streptomyces sp. NPDC090741 TaxID=3365967 RepID=UPI0037F140F5
MSTGKRFPFLEALLESLRVVTTPSGLDRPAAAKFRADAALVEEWRGHWQDATLLQRRAQAANKRVRATVRQVHEDAVRDAEPYGPWRALKWRSWACLGPGGDMSAGIRV